MLKIKHVKLTKHEKLTICDIYIKKEGFTDRKQFMIEFIKVSQLI